MFENQSKIIKLLVSQINKDKKYDKNKNHRNRKLCSTRYID